MPQGGSSGSFSLKYKWEEIDPWFVFPHFRAFFQFFRLRFPRSILRAERQVHHHPQALPLPFA